MTEGGGGSPVDRLRAILARIADLPAVRGLRTVLDTYGRAGGGLLAGGLAFGTVFALVPITLLVVGISGFFVADPAVRATVLSGLAARVPALREFIELALLRLSEGAAGLSIVGLVGLAWTSSQFYGQLDTAFARIFRKAPPRGMVERTARGLIAVAAATGAFTLLVTVAILATNELPGVTDVNSLGPLLRIGTPVVATLAIVGLLGVVYRFVPNRRIAWSLVWLPAVSAGIGLALLSGLFVFLAPFLASERFFGPFVPIFASLAWLNWSFQIVLIGAAWVRERALVLDGRVGDGPAEGAPRENHGRREADPRQDAGSATVAR